MQTAHYDMLRHFADSWGLLYMMAIFLAVVFFLLRPGARANAVAAARIPLEDAQPKNRGEQR
uniref:Putative FixQ1 cbb3-type cytochrome oxidase n=1 Tax=uncultured bacterium 1062 TaxID=548898 RepID=B8R8Y3_9BACT|nr:putative FixQ1 cbb3-type cytochrome oxidase [uncultured bacterium 1062]